MTAPKGGQFVLHAKALSGNPFDRHTLGPIVAGLERLTGVEVRRFSLLLRWFERLLRAFLVSLLRVLKTLRFA